MSGKFIISPKTKVGMLLDTYPQLEKVLMDMSPMFEKLKNPILRKTVARVATLQQVAAVGGLRVEDIVNRLRQELGITETGTDETGAEFVSSEIPSWFDAGKVTDTYDASPVINSGGSPMTEILRRSNMLKAGEIFELSTPFVPAPIIEMLKGKGFKVHTIQHGNGFITYIQK